MAWTGLSRRGGFGERGAEGEIQAARYAREQGMPYLGLCRGMQNMVIEFTRHVLNLPEANSTEFDPANFRPGDLLAGRAARGGG